MKTITIEQWDNGSIEQRDRWLSENVILDEEGVETLRIRTEVDIKNGTIRIAD